VDGGIDAFRRWLTIFEVVEYMVVRSAMRRVRTEPVCDLYRTSEPALVDTTVLTGNIGFPLTM
jgi:hypothetical protein